MALRIFEKLRNIGRGSGFSDEVDEDSAINRFNKPDEPNEPTPFSKELKEDTVSSDQEWEEEKEKKNDTYQCFQVNENMDKATLDLLNSVNQIVRSRQYTEQNLEEHQVRLSHSQNQNIVLNKEITLVKGILAQKGKEISQLESKVSDKNIKIDNLMEEIREGQSAMSNEIKELNKTIDIEQQKYKKYKEQYEKESMDMIIKLKQKEELIIQLETENNTLKKSYDKLEKDNKYLLNMINDFTDRMSLSFDKVPGQKNTYEN